jgi:Tfp pilus assembly protein PilF
LARGRNLQQLGRDHDALRLFRRLAAFGDLPADIAEETQACLAQLYLNQRRYRQARRHLAAALTYQPENAGYHYLMARAEYAEDTGDPHQAAEHYRKSIELDPNQPRCCAEYGRLAFDQEKIEEGIQALVQAIELAPNDPEPVCQLVRGLCEAHRTEEAQQVLQAARFRNPADRRFLQLWQDFQFQQLLEAQVVARREEAAATPDGDPTLLPFQRPTTAARTGCLGRRHFRRDSATPPAPPHSTMPSPYPEQRQA